MENKIENNLSAKKGVCIILTIIAWVLMYYFLLPPLNIHSQQMWSFIVSAVMVAIVINFYNIVHDVFIVKNPFERKEFFRKSKKTFILPISLFILYSVGLLLSSPIIRASDYNKLLSVEKGDFSTDIYEVNYNQIPILDADSASRLAAREMGSLVDMVSQYEVSPYFSQINYQGKPVRVTPLMYGDAIKWLTNTASGIPGYMKIDMTTQDVELVQFDEEGIKYSPFEYFNRNLARHVRFNYPTEMIRYMDFEIDEEGNPFWVCSVEDKTIGLFGGTDIKGMILVNALNGDHEYYDVSDVPSWVDQVYDARLLIEQYNYYGMLTNGFINSILGQRDVLQSTEGYNYVALDGDVWVYTGVTSVGSDQSNVGFVLMNARTKETKYYQISGAKEISAMSSAEGQVQHLGYTATFPILINIAGEPTYFLSLKDSAGLVKKYAMVNIQKYQIVATGDTVQECEQVYKNLMSGNGIDTTENLEVITAKGAIETMKEIVVDGNTVIYIKLEDSENLYGITVYNNLEILLYSITDEISFEYVENEESNIHNIVSIK